MNLKPGDVVMLKSGGQPLTVAEVNGDKIGCMWMGDEGDLFHETLPSIVLELALIETSEEDEQENEDDLDVEGDDEDETSKVA
jgi:uncharacterized protein YodC (DUF2158 family)